MQTKNVNLVDHAVRGDAQNAVMKPEIQAAAKVFAEGGSPSQQIKAARKVWDRNIQYTSHFGSRQQQRAWERILKLHDKTTFPFIEDNCPGHVAWVHSDKFRGNCGIHVDSLRPADD